MKHKIALIEIQQETNSFSPLLTTRRDFEAMFLKYGDEILPDAQVSKFQTGGFYRTATEYGRDSVQIVPIVCAWAQSGGPLTREVFAHFKEVIATGLQRHPDLAGIWLSMHGAMGVEGISDPEGDLLRWLREQVGDALPIVLPLDLHANITRRMVQHTTCISAYHTNPHRDHFQTGVRSAKLLIDTVLGRIKPTMAYCKLPLLKGGGYNIDFLAPMRRIFGKVRQLEKRKGVLSAAIFPVHIWLDDPELGWSTVVVTDNDPALAKQLAEELAAMCWAVRDVAHPQPDTPETALQKVRKAQWQRLVGTAILCDVSDVVSAGAPGENTHLIRTILEQAPDLVAYTSIRDAEVARQVFEQQAGTSVSVVLGGKLETHFNAPLPLEAILFRKFENATTGKAVVLQRDRTFVVVTEHPNPVMKPQFYKDAGLNLWKADVVVVKNLFPFRYFFLRYNRLTLNVLSAGVTNIDVQQLDYRLRPVPLYPLENVDYFLAT
ncbi:MAG: M81 family metallopeptidase [Spirosomaceae bacterium]|nr:M81 family metallopeptidase [Spirosomataceae bacterium]